MSWEVLVPHGDGWRYVEAHPSVDHAIASIALKLGKILHGTLEDNGTYRVTDLDGQTVACVREVIHWPPGVGPPGPLRRYRGHTWVGWLNFLLLRWFLVRIAYTVEEDNTISRYALQFVPSWRWR